MGLSSPKEGRDTCVPIQKYRSTGFQDSMIVEAFRVPTRGELSPFTEQCLIDRGTAIMRWAGPRGRIVTSLAGTGGIWRAGKTLEPGRFVAKLPSGEVVHYSAHYFARHYELISDAPEPAPCPAGGRFGEPCDELKEAPGSAPTDEGEPKPRFQIGDRVRFANPRDGETSNHYEHYRACFGKAGLVESLQGIINPLFEVRFPGDDDTFPFYGDELESVKDQSDGPTAERHVYLERTHTIAAGEAYGLDPEAVAGLISFAEDRALDGPVRLDRDFVQEIAEEIADARNYCVWELIHNRDPEIEAVDERVMRAHALLAQAWAVLGYEPEGKPVEVDEGVLCCEGSGPTTRSECGGCSHFEGAAA